MSLKKYEALLKTIDLGSLTKAADALGYTQSGISHMINALEEECGVHLLMRDRSGVRLTSDGEVLLPYMRNVCNDNHALLEKINDIKGVKSGLIRIGAFTSVCVQWLPGIIKSFKAECPDIDFEFMYGDYAEIEKWIEQGRVDCGFLRMPAVRDIKTYFLKSDPLVVVMSPENPYAQCESFPVKALREFPYIQLDEGTDHEIDAIFDNAGIKPDVSFTATDDYAIMAMVAHGLGISILPELVLYGTNQNIVSKKLSEPVSRNICVGVHDDNMTAATECFIKHTLSSLSLG